MVLGRPRRLQVLHRHGRVHRRALVGHDEAGGCHVRDVEIVVHRVEVDVRGLRQDGEGPDEVGGVQHAIRLLHGVDLEARDLLEDGVDGIAVRHGKLHATRTLDVLDHLREELDAKLRVAAKAELLAKAHDGSRARVRLLGQLARRHARQQAGVLQQVIGNRPL